MPLRRLKDVYYICEAGPRCLNAPKNTNTKTSKTPPKKPKRQTLHGHSCVSCDCALACSDTCVGGFCMDCCEIRSQVCMICCASFRGFHCGHHNFFNPKRLEAPHICPVCVDRHFPNHSLCGSCGILVKSRSNSLVYCSECI